MSVSYAPFDAEGVIVGVVDADENIKQLLNLFTIFVVDVKVVYIYECLGIVVCVFPSRIVLWLDIRGTAGM